MQDKMEVWNPEGLSRLRRLAIKWFSENGRKLPWRITSDPYAIWVSEIMLQQTQVATVIPFYHRFLASFPDVVSLAEASLDDVYRHWAGLGYYRRARQMHQTAQLVKEAHAGVFPTDFQSVRELPGIGRYTAGAILSFSADQRQPIVEANTQRLYARLLHLKQETTSKTGQSHLWSFAKLVLPKRKGSGSVNQALMEIGSQVCLPKNPLCLVCPLSDLCPTFKSGSQAMIPVPKPPKDFTDLREVALVIYDSKGRFLMRRCGSKERWAGLWDFPRFDVTPCKTEASEAIHVAEQFRERFGKSVRIGQKIHELKHAVTRYRIQLKSYEAEIDSSVRARWKEEVETLWADVDELSKLALSSSGKRLWNSVLRNRNDE
ncbi:MAG: A/G-specific adenine glycosylase [Planctomycetota bacterium]|nr:A/G-specific adenine glycosylase [Planctomycetota bacterium]